MAKNFRSGKIWVVKIFVCFLVFLVHLISAGGATLGSSSSTLQQKLEVKKYLKKLNRPAVKSIKSPDGDIIDCVHVLHQPAFDHPLLKNHTIQMRPSFHPEGLTFGESKDSSKSKPITQLWHLKGRCPERTVPIRRTRKDDILRARSVQEFGKKQSQTIPKPKSAVPDQPISQSGHQYAIVYVEGEKYHGARANINVWNPKIQQPDEFSLSQIWLLGGSSGPDLNSMETGWQVNPKLYGDNKTRLFTYWTSDGYKDTGCYNLLCVGFVQTSSEIALGSTISPLSVYEKDQYDIQILIWKDPKDGNWWMQFGKDQVVGYWPTTLFSTLKYHASVVEWGGEVVNLGSGGQHTYTEMGSGHFPNGGYGKASFFKNIKVVGLSNRLLPPNNIGTSTDNANCYDIQTGSGGEWENYFYYGGPGINPKCTV